MPIPGPERHLLDIIQTPKPAELITRSALGGKDLRWHYGRTHLGGVGGTNKHNKRVLIAQLLEGR